MTPTGRPPSQTTTEPTFRSRISSPTWRRLSALSAVTTPWVITSEIRTGATVSGGVRSGRSRLRHMSSENPFGGLFGDPDELRRRMAEFAEQMQGAQRVAWADNAIKLAVDMSVAGLQRMNLQGNAEQQAQDLLQAMRLIFPEAVILVREAREGFGTDS